MATVPTGERADMWRAGRRSRLFSILTALPANAARSTSAPSASRRRWAVPQLPPPASLRSRSNKAAARATGVSALLPARRSSLRRGRREELLYQNELCGAGQKGAFAAANSSMVADLKPLGRSACQRNRINRRPVNASLQRTARRGRGGRGSRRRHLIPSASSSLPSSANGDSAGAKRKRQR